jgi:hypothetical protein
MNLALAALRRAERCRRCSHGFFGLARADNLC